MINPKHKNVFMAPDALSAGASESSTGDSESASVSEPLVINGHTINSKLCGTGRIIPCRTIAETLRKANGTNGQTIGSALPAYDTPKHTYPGGSITH